MYLIRAKLGDFRAKLGQIRAIHSGKIRISFFFFFFYLSIFLSDDVTCRSLCSPTPIKQIYNSYISSHIEEKKSHNLEKESW